MDRVCPTDQPARAVSISAVDRKVQVLAAVLVDHKVRVKRRWDRAVHLPGRVGDLRALVGECWTQRPV